MLFRSENVLEEGDTSDSALPDGASIDLTTVSRAQVVDVTGKAVAAQARLTMVRSNPSSPNLGVGSGSSSSTPRSAGPPPPAFADASSPASDTPPLPSSASQVSRVSAARRRSTRKSKASLRLPASISSNRTVMRSRSRSAMRGEANGARKAARSKSRSKKGKERERDAAPLLSADVGGSFLEMEGRPAGEEDADADGEVDVVDEVREESAQPDAEPRTGA